MASEVVEVATESEEDVRFRYSGKNSMRFAVFWRISVRFCGFRTPLTPPSIHNNSEAKCILARGIGRFGESRFRDIGISP